MTAESEFEFGGSGSGEPPLSRSRVGTILKVIGPAAMVGLVAIVIWGFRYHPGYSELIPGDAQPIPARVAVHGAKQYPPKGNFYLVFVRERENLSYWEYLRAKWFDDHAEIDKIPPGSPATNSQENACMMQDSQATAKKVALEKLGYKLKTKPGVLVQAIFSTTAPVAKVLRCGDTLREISGARTDTPQQLQTAIGQHKPGDVVTVVFERDGKRNTKTVRLISDSDGHTKIGIFAQAVTVYPVSLTIDTGAIGGPSAGLAMTLTLLDELTPGELTGTQRVVATGTIEPDGTVGEIGAIDLKAVAVQRRHADLFLVPACSEDPGRAPRDLANCQAGIVAARANAHGVKVVPVSSLDDALRVLVQQGGDPLPALRQ